MIADIQTIPELLIKTRGNQTEVARMLKSSRGTIKKYAGDRKAQRHAIVNGTLMIFRGEQGIWKRRAE
ncbi:protein ninH [Erwinia sorbitola]|uniref:Protein ninH n=1 Tax=Erwinia sorbitola TaxID=2681984 RepID=A0A6I6EKC4_9GAMM|nr:protein ninH [Erwinia sorbitola]QGU87061.1 protein ninH [Erwinia sorbitola]